MSAPATKVAQRAPARKPAVPRRRPVESAPARRPAARPRKAPVRRSTVVFVVVTGVIVVLMVLGLVAMNALLAQSSFQIDDLQSRVTKLTQDYQQHRLEVAELSSPARIAHAAAESGLVPADGGIQILSPHQIHRSHPKPHGGKAVGGRP